MTSSPSYKRRGDIIFQMTAHQIAKRIINCFESGGKLLICGNGGSASMSSHFAAEMVSKFEKDRAALPAISLTVDPAVMTSIANDYGYERVFSRQLEAIGHTNDLLIVLSTSGKSKNCMAALRWASEFGMESLDWPREKGGGTAAKQEYQLQLIHDVCRIVENHFV